VAQGMRWAPSDQMELPNHARVINHTMTLSGQRSFRNRCKIPGRITTTQGIKNPSPAPEAKTTSFAKMCNGKSTMRLTTSVYDQLQCANTYSVHVGVLLGYGTRVGIDEIAFTPYGRKWMAGQQNPKVRGYRRNLLLGLGHESSQSV